MGYIGFFELKLQELFLKPKNSENITKAQYSNPESIF